MKKTLFAILLVAGSFAANAQQGVKLGGGVNVGFPISNFQSQSVGAGLDLDLLAHLSSNFAVTGDVGYNQYFGKKNYLAPGVNAPNVSIIPLRAGLRFYPTENLFLLGKIGAGFVKAKDAGSVTSTAYSFGVGYAMDPSWEVAASYDGYSKSGSFAVFNIHLGYWFGNGNYKK